MTVFDVAIDESSRANPLSVRTRPAPTVDRMRIERDPGRADHWLAIDDHGDEIAHAAIWTRPDERTFVALTGDEASIGPLTGRVADDTRRPLHSVVDDADTGRHRALERAGFEIELTEDAFTVPFDRAIRSFARAPTPTGITLISAADADRDRLVELDNLIRQDVPGCDGWRADRAWIDDELADQPPFAPDAYLIGVDDDTGGYAGLIRVWRNRSTPRLGLVGVARPYRSTTLAAALLRRGLSAASRWGSPNFTTETATSNTVIHRRMERLGGAPTRRFHQLVRMPS